MGYRVKGLGFRVESFWIIGVLYVGHLRGSGLWVFD